MAGASEALVACFRPLTAYRTREGSVTFDSSGSHGANPLQLPCGQCIGCRIERSKQWALRCVHEAQMHERNSFITLTYNDEHLPPDDGLDIRDWQNFAKRLRHLVGPFRFFHCGEYGTDNLRPHYHALIFGEDFAADRIEWTRNERKEWRYISPMLEQTWGLGFCTVGALTYESAAYCARYTMKKVNGAQAHDAYSRFNPETGEVWQVKPEYVTMSRRPGIAHEWYEAFNEDVYPADEVVHEAKRHRPPRYYDDKLPPQLLETIKQKRRKKVEKRKQELTPERLKTRERHAQLQAQRLERRV